MTQPDDLDAPETLLTPSEVAALFRVNPKTVTRWARCREAQRDPHARRASPLPGLGDPPLPRGDVARAGARRRRRLSTTAVSAARRARGYRSRPRAREDRNLPHGHQHRCLLHPPARAARQPTRHARPPGDGDRRRRREHHRHRRLRRPRRPPRRGRAGQLLLRGAHRTGHRGGARGRRRRGHRGRRPHLRDARGRQDRGARADADRRPRRPLDGLHPGRGAGVHGDRAAAGAGPRAHDQEEHRRHRHRRHRRARPRRHRPRRRPPGHGGQGAAVQELRRRRRLPDLPRRHHAGRDRRDGRADRPGVRRHQPRGHRRAGVLRDRGSPQGAARHPGVPRRPARHRGRRARPRWRARCGSSTSR